jgi:hypothetical protein|tara:strand:- start:2470 stop:5043 length:2574 start_codon:yes stop_codon:yes gene_type:complete
MAEIRVEIRHYNTSTLSFDVHGDLDIVSSDDFPLSLTFKNFDVRDLNSRGGSFSKSFKVPATKNNNKIFGHIHKDGNIDTKGVKRDLDSIIYLDNSPIISGTIRMSKIISNKDVIEYECVFLGDNMNWASNIKNLDLKELRFSSQAYTSYPPATEVPFTFENPRTTWGDYIFNQDQLIYPLITIGESDSSANASIDSDFIPCVYIKNVWDKIFQAQGYTVSSTFCDSTFFKNLIMPLIFQKPKEITDLSFGRVSSSVEETIFTLDYGETNEDVATQVPRSIGNQSFTIDEYGFTDSDFVLDFIASADTLQDDAPLQQGEDTDDYGNAQLGVEHTGGFKNGLVVAAQGSGTFNLNAEVSIEFNSDGDSNAGKMSYQFQVSIAKLTSGDNDDGTFTDLVVLQNNTQTIFLNPVTTQSHQFNLEALDVSAEAGDIFALKIKFIHKFATRESNTNPNTNTITIKTKPNSYLQIEQTGSFFNGEEIKGVQNMLPKGTQADFVKGLSQLFNLQFKTDPISKIVYVEPYDHFYKSTSEAVDWSDKIDYSKDIENEFLHDIKSKILFKYKDASNDGLINRYNKRNNVDWGAYQEIDDSGKFAIGEFKIENSYFSPTFNWVEPNYVVSDKIAQSPLIPMYFSEYSDLSISNAIERPEKEFEIGARILIRTAGSNNGKWSSSNGKRMLNYYNTDNIDNDNLTKYYWWKKASFCAFDNLNCPLTRSEDGVEAFNHPPINTLSEHTISDGYNNLNFNLSFSDISHDTVISTSREVKKGLYSLYYSKMIEQLKQNPRLKIVYLNLKVSDMMLLDFQKLVYINGVYYRINKIIDFQPHKQQSTKVELQEYVFLGDTTTPTALHIDAENINL